MVIDVEDSNTFLSAQDDVAEARAAYGRPEILQQLERLDSMEKDLRYVVPPKSLLLGTLAICRRYISWLLPTEKSPAATADLGLALYSQLLFEDPHAWPVFELYAWQNRLADKVLVEEVFSAALQHVRCRPSPESLSALQSAILADQETDPAMKQCMDSLARQIPRPVLLQMAEPTVRVLVSAAHYCRHSLQSDNISPQQQHQVMDIVYAAANRPRPANTRFHPTLTRSVALSQGILKGTGAPELTAIYCNAYLWRRAKACQFIHDAAIEQLAKCV